MMSKIRVVHYINNFFANIGGEEKANIPPEIREGKIGPGLALEAALGDEYEIVATAICGDSYFGDNIEEAKATLVEMIVGYEPDLFVAGPAFNAGRYGTACGSIAKEIEERLEIPVITGMYPENPGVDIFKIDLNIVKTPISAVGMRKAMKTMAKIAKKMINKEEVLSPAEEGYIERGIRVNYFNEDRGSKRAVEMLVNKMKKEEFVTEYPMPVFDRVTPCPAIKDLTNIKLAVVTSGGLVPQGNPDKIESSSASKYGIYSIAGMDSMDKKDFMTIHGGYDRAFITEDPNLCVPLDVLREYEKEGVFAELADYYIATTGTGTSVGNAKGFGESLSKKLIADGVGAVLLTST
jgi:glycine reductase